MSPARLIAALAVFLMPFLFLAADHGVPSGTWWDDAKDPAVWLLCVVVMAALVVGLRELISSRVTRQDAIVEDLERLARRAFVPINAHLPDVPISKLGVHVWRTDGDKLTRVVKYTMEGERIETSVVWTRGKGAIGLAWDRRTALVADLTDLYARANAMDASDFDAMDPDVRYGLSAEEARRGSSYKSILAYPVTSDGGEHVIGVISVDCAVDGQVAKLEALLEDPVFLGVLGSCQSALRDYRRG